MISLQSLLHLTSCMITVIIVSQWQYRLDIYNIMVERTDPTRGFRRVSPPLPNDSRYKFAKTSPVLPNQRAEDPSHGRIFGRL